MIQFRLLGPWSPALVLCCGLLLAGGAWWLYRRELRTLALGSAAWTLPLLRCLAILLIALTLAEPVLEYRKREGQPGRILILLDASQSMAITDTVPDSASLQVPVNRFERAAQSLLHPDQGLLPSLASEFEVSLRRFGGGRQANDNKASDNKASVQLWESSLSQVDSLPTSGRGWQPVHWASASALGDALAEALEVANESPDAARTALVVLSDGQSNSGQSPIAAAQALAAAELPVFTVGYGHPQEPPDLALRSVEGPLRVARTDNLRGSLQISDSLPQGTPFVAELVHADRVVWRQDFLADGSNQRSIDFEIPVEPMFEAESKTLPPGTEYAYLPLKLEASLKTQANEASSENNSAVLALSVASQKSRLLLIDGRSRWETRYLRNVFSRDPAWEVKSVLADAHHSDGASPSQAGSEQHRLPGSREELEQYNLVILGDAPADLWTAEQLQWLSDFVERGGGLILIDGARGHLRDTEYAPLTSLLPMRWSDAQQVESGASVLPSRVELTAAGAALPALVLATGTAQTEASTDNRQQWSELPAIEFISAVEALPGSEALVEAVSESARQPILLTRRFGAGRVVYWATDETWRWRYKVADVVHQRLWNQIARWVMRVPMSVRSEFVSLDTGAARVESGQPVEVNCSLRNLDGSLAADRIVSAIVKREGQIVARVPLAAKKDIPGNYAAEIRGLAAGDYQVQIEAAGYPKDILEMASKFTVVAAPSQEMQAVACNESLLQQIAAITKGQAFTEENVADMLGVLRPLSGGRITQSTTIVWQSYWWFMAALLLLVIEWILRKRNGLI